MHGILKNHLLQKKISFYVTHLTLQSIENVQTPQHKIKYLKH